MSTADEKGKTQLHLRAAAERQIDNAPLIGGDPAHPDGKLLHELQVHQVELEMQNEALRQAQTALEESRDRYLNLYEFAPIGYLVLTPDGLISEINLTGIKLLGKERQELLQMRFAALVIAEDQDRWTQLCLNVKRLAGGRVELALQRGDGSVLQAQLDCERQKVGAGDTAIRIALTDIGERKRSEDALDKFFEQSTNLHVIAQLDGVIRRANRGWDTALGYDKNQLVGSNFLDLVHADDKAATIAEMARLAQGITTFHFENRYRHKNGEFRQMVWSATVDAGNQLIYAVASDSTAQKQAEEKLISQSQRLLLATSSAGLGVWDWNLRDNTMTWDDRMFEIYGTTRESFSGNIDAWMNGLHPEDKEQAIAERQAALRGEKEFDTVFRVLQPNGTVKYLKANGLVMRDADGTATRMLGINADITESKRLELALMQSKEELQGLARSMVAVREEDRRKIARELHDDLGHRLTTLSIDLERMESKLLPSESATKAKFQEIIDHVYQTVDAIRRICEDLRPGMLDALGLPAAIESHVKTFAARTGIPCELVMSHDDFSVDGNVAINIFRIVQETLNNSMKYSKASNILVTLQFSAHEISLIVEDNGIGMAERDKGGRIGFGLLGMRERVANLNGQLSISSDPGRGVRIEAVIPT